MHSVISLIFDLWEDARDQRSHPVSLGVLTREVLEAHLDREQRTRRIASLRELSEGRKWEEVRRVIFGLWRIC